MSRLMEKVEDQQKQIDKIIKTLEIISSNEDKIIAILERFDR